MNIHKRMHHMPWFDCTASLADLHSSVLRRNTVLSALVGGHRCTVELPSQKKWKCLLSNTKNGSDSLGSKAGVLRSNVLSGPLKSLCIRVKIIIRQYLALFVVLVVVQINSTAVMISDAQCEGLLFAGWQVVVLCLLFPSAPALSVFFIVLSKI